MPKQGSVGHSDYTNLKQAIFAGFLNFHMRIVKAIAPDYHYIDLTAGSGEPIGLYDASPLAFLKAAERFNLDFRAYFFEENQGSASQLSNRVSEYKNVTVVNASNDLLENHYQPNNRHFGLVYADPNAVPPFEVFKRLSKAYLGQQLDFLINCPATTVKRVRTSRSDPTDRCLIDYLNQINKKHWFIRAPYGYQQWTFLIGTNWDKFPVWHKGSFFPIDSDDGKMVLDRLSLTTEEFKKKHGMAPITVPVQLELPL